MYNRRRKPHFVVSQIDKRHLQGFDSGRAGKLDVSLVSYLSVKAFSERSKPSPGANTQQAFSRPSLCGKSACVPAMYDEHVHHIEVEQGKVVGLEQLKIFNVQGHTCSSS